MPVARPFRIWLKRSAEFRSVLEGPDVLAGRVLHRQRRRARGDDVGEVHGALHRVLLLAPHEEVRPQRLVRFGLYAARATPDDHGPMMNLAPSESTASSARRVALPALVSSSRVMYLMDLPCTFIPRSSRASFMPRSRTGPTSEKAPANDQRPSMTTSFCWALSTAGNPSPAPAATPPSFSTSRRVYPLMSVLRARVGSIVPGWLGGARIRPSGPGVKPRGAQSEGEPLAGCRGP